MQASVIICTHNPNTSFLTRTLQALRSQDVPLAEWELLLIDNASTVAVGTRFDLSWHPNGRHIVESELGISAARIRGMREAATDLILYVDDDNLLASDYLRRGLELARQHPEVGCWGGQLLPEFEEKPAAWTERWWSYLAIRPLSADLRTRNPREYDSIPPTAGAFIRRCVWERYLKVIQEDPRHLVLGLRGTKRISGQDTDIALCSFELGLETARFAELRLVHIMPRNRLEEGYLLRLVESISFSTVILEGLRGGKPPVTAARLTAYAREWMRGWRLPKRTRRFYHAELRGRRHGVHELTRLGSPAASAL